jgi:hypothetical protein
LKTTTQKNQTKKKLISSSEQSAQKVRFKSVPPKQTQEIEMEQNFEEEEEEEKSKPKRPANLTALTKELEINE